MGIVTRCWPPRRDARHDKNSTRQPPTSDSGEGGRIFGSAHSGGCVFVLCDGSVRQFPYDIDPLMFAYLGNRKDAATVDLSSNMRNP